MSLVKLEQLIKNTDLANYTRHSRVHKLKSYSNRDCHCFVKREDELSFGVSGSKLRKYLSLIPSLIQKSFDEVILLGSAYSNHILGCSQILREHGIKPIFFLLGNKPNQNIGNALFSRLFVDSQDIFYFPKKTPEEIENFAQGYIAKKKAAGIKVGFVPIGGSCKEALVGCLTLALDLLRNESELGFAFDHLIIDAGTGWTAACLVQALNFLNKNTYIHIILVAGKKEEFSRVLEEVKKEMEHLFQFSLPSPTRFFLYQPHNAKSFGGINAHVFRTIVTLAQQEGFLTDPIYTAKLFDEGKALIEKDRLKGNILFIHSGGAFSLAGFQDELARWTKMSPPSI